MGIVIARIPAIQQLAGLLYLKRLPDHYLVEPLETGSCLGLLEPFPVVFSRDSSKRYISALSVHRVGMVWQAQGYCKAPCGYGIDRMASETWSDIGVCLQQA